MTTRLSCAMLASAWLALVATPAAADMPVAMSLMKMDWDARDPSRLPYQEFNIDSTINKAFVDAWATARVSMADKVVAEVSRPNALKGGITLYKVDLRLTPSDPTASLVVAGPRNGTIKLLLPKNVITFSARNSITPGYADPTFRATFDIVVDIDFGLARSNSAPMQVTRSTATLANTHVDAVDLPAIFATVTTEELANIFGWKSLPDRIKDGMNASRIDVGQLAGSNTTKQLALLMTGYDSTGGRIDRGRITLGGARIKSLPAANVWLRAHWNASYGRVLANCDPVEFAITVAYAPPSYGDTAPLTKPLRPQGTSGSTPAGSDLACTQSISSLAGVAATLTYKQVIGNASGGLTPGASRSLHLVPVKLPNPLVAGDPTRDAADFVVEVKDAMHDGKQLLDQAGVLRNPGDPGPRVAKPNMGDPAARVAHSARVADELNPQPLPPGPPPEMKAGNVPKVIVPAAVTHSAPVTTGTSLKSGASPLTDAPQSGLR